VSGHHRLLAARGELTPRLVLRASVSASVRAAPDPRATGNRVGVLLVPLPVAEADPARRLAQIAAATAARKRQPPVAGPNASLLQRPMISMMLPDGKVILPGVVTHSANVVEHPELVADRIVRFAEAVGRENVVASTDCGLGGRVHPQIAWAKLDTLVKGAELAASQLWGYSRHGPFGG
jgi:hypothetical protein